MQQPENFLPKVLQCSRCLKAFHTKAKCPIKEKICRYFSGSHPLKECQPTIADTDIKKPNPKRKCANGLGQHSARFLGCPYLQQYKDATMKTRPTNTAHQKALHRDEGAKEQAPHANKGLQDQVTRLKEQISKIAKQLEERSSIHQANISCRRRNRKCSQNPTRYEDHTANNRTRRHQDDPDQRGNNSIAPKMKNSSFRKKGQKHRKEETRQPINQSETRLTRRGNQH